MLQPTKANKKKLRTLCTIDTSDIDLREGKHRNHRNSSKNKYKNMAIMTISDKNQYFSKKTPKNLPNEITFKSKQKRSHKELSSNKNVQESTHNRKTSGLKSFSCSNSRKTSNFKYNKVNGNQTASGHQFAKTYSMGSSSCSNKLKLNKNMENTQTKSVSKPKNKMSSKLKFRQTKTQNILKQYRHKTEHSYTNQKNDFLAKTMHHPKNTLSKDIKMKTLLKTSNNFYNTEEIYRSDFFVIVGRLQTTRNEGIQIVRMPNTAKSQSLHLLKKTKDKDLKIEYRQQLDSYKKMNLYPLNQISQKYPKNILKLQQHYRQKNTQYLLYEHSGTCIDWENNIHQQIIKKILKNEGTVLRYIIKQIARGIHELSKRGFCHGNLCTENIILKISQKPNTISLQGNIKIADLHKSFHISQKKYKLTEFQANIFTPPEIINYIIFQNKNYASNELEHLGRVAASEKFDREMIQYIGVYDQPWYCDVWALGIIVIQLLAGQSISIEKCLVEENRFKFPKNEISHNKNFDTIVSDKQLDEISVELEEKPETDSWSKIQSEHSDSYLGAQIQLKQKDIRLFDDTVSFQDILSVQTHILSQTSSQIQLLDFDPTLQSLLIRMLSTNPLLRPSPKQIITSL